MRHTIGLPNGKSVSIPTYLASWRQLMALPPEQEITGWEWYAVKAGDALARLRASIHDRINRHAPGYGAGRKWADQWQRDAQNTARMVNTPRLAIHWLPADLRPRLAHRLSE